MAAISLNEIISVLSDTVGQPFNMPLQERLKVIINYKRANYTQQFLEKHPDQRRFFQQSITVDVEKVAPGDCDIPETTCDLLVTKCEVAMPVRSSWSLFDFVGTADWKSGFGETKPEFNQFNHANRYTKTKVKWTFINNKIYLFNNLEIKKIGVRSVFADPYSVNCCCDAGTCFSDDSPYPISPDILNSIMRDVLNVELRNVFPQMGAVEIPEEKSALTPAGNNNNNNRR